MPDLPGYMMQLGRPVDEEFLPDEELYRRVKPEYWDPDGINVDAIEFPDMSVTRSKYGPAESVRWERGEYVFWGVYGFLVGDIPAKIPFQGAFHYDLEPKHVPHRKNYPHSEVQVFENPWDQPDLKVHIDDQKIEGIPRAAKQIWRDLLRRKCRIVLHPNEMPQEDS